MAKLLLGVTGSVAAIKTPLLARQLLAAGHELKIVATKAARYFFDPRELPAEAPLFADSDEWPGDGYSRGDPVLHIELRRWAEQLLVAPLDANTLAKFAHGLADNCLSCVWRAWDIARPIALAPAMNTLMWQHPVTLLHCRAIAQFYRVGEPGPDDLDAWIHWFNARGTPLTIVPPQVKQLACGDVGNGGLAELPAIVASLGVPA